MGSEQPTPINTITKPDQPIDIPEDSDKTIPSSSSISSSSSNFDESDFTPINVTSIQAIPFETTHSHPEPRPNLVQTQQELEAQTEPHPKQEISYPQYPQPEDQP